VFPTASEGFRVSNLPLRRDVGLPLFWAHRYVLISARAALRAKRADTDNTVFRWHTIRDDTDIAVCFHLESQTTVR
jgi:hypothetical protein